MNQKELQNIFTYHAPDSGQIPRYQELRDKGHDLAALIHLLCPDSRERSLAITSIQQAIMWANAAIAINEAPRE